jgi:hypothetical protein
VLPVVPSTWAWRSLSVAIIAESEDLPYRSTLPVGKVSGLRIRDIVIQAAKPSLLSIV